MEDSTVKIILSSFGGLFAVFASLVGWNIKRVESIKDDVAECEKSHLRHEVYYRDMRNLKEEHTEFKSEMKKDINRLYDKLDARLVEVKKELMMQIEGMEKRWPQK